MYIYIHIYIYTYTHSNPSKPIQLPWFTKPYFTAHPTPGILGGRVEPGIASGVLVTVEEHDVFVLVQHVPCGFMGIHWGKDP